MTTPEERIAGGVAGLALGDALGAPFEGRRTHEVPDPLPALELSWMGRSPGATTDDTAMARNVWSSLIAHGGALVLDDVLARHLAWLAADPPDVDQHVRRVLAGWRDGEPDPARAYVATRGPEVSAGNGSVAACAPVSFAYAWRPGELRDVAPPLSSLTHADERCRTACLAVALAAAALVRGVPSLDAVRDALSAIEGLEGAEELEYLVGGAGVARPIDGPDRGFVLFTAGVALRTVGEGRGVEPGLRSVVALGGDTGTNAAVAGALLGAARGVDALPTAWLDRLADRDAIEAEAGALAELVVGAAPPSADELASRAGRGLDRPGAQ